MTIPAPTHPSSNLDDLPRLIRDGDALMWGQTNGQPSRLVEAVIARRAAWRRLKVFLGVSQSPVPGPEHGDLFEYSAYCGSGHNRALLKAGLLDILPLHYSQLPRVIGNGQLPVDVLLLQVSPPEVAAYGLVMFAALLRVFAPLIAPQYLIASIVMAAIAWALAFALYLAVFAPWLMRTRLDGKDG